MEKKYKIPTLLLLVTIFFGCQTEELTNTSIVDDNNAVAEQTVAAYDFKVKVVNDVLSFETREDFDKAIDYLANIGDENFEAWENEVSFKSMRSVFSESELDKIGIDDNLLAVFLNPEGLISFGENTFKVNYLSNEVVMILNSDLSSKSSFQTSKSKRTFQADDDIFGILDGSVSEGESLAISARSCGRNKQRRIYRNIGSDQYEMKIVYQRSWPLYSLQAKIKRRNGASSVEETNIGVETVYNSFYKKKRSRSCVKFAGRSAGGLGREYNLRVYYSSRKLRAYDFYVNFYGSNTRGTYSSFERITCSSC